MKKHISKLCFSFLIVITTLYINTLIKDYYLNKTQVENAKKDKLALVQKQLDLFYMPLQSTLHKSKISWQDYRSHYGDKKDYAAIESGEINEETLRWQRYMLCVFQPLHLELSNILTSRNLVLKYSVINLKLDKLQIHIDQYKVIFSQWKADDLSGNISISKFPDGIEEIVNEDIIILNQKKVIIIESLSIIN